MGALYRIQRNKTTFLHFVDKDNETQKLSPSSLRFKSEEKQSSFQCRDPRAINPDLTYG